jgi:hypothetical protein
MQKYRLRSPLLTLSFVNGEVGWTFQHPHTRPNHPLSSKLVTL